MIIAWLDAMLRDAADDITAFADFPVAHWTKIRSTNPLVIWGPSQGVRHVVDERLDVRELCAGRGYLRPSSRRLAGGPVFVQRVVLPETRHESWTVVGDDAAPIEGVAPPAQIAS